MFDLIKTFILGIWIEKKYRYFFIFIIITLIYRFFFFFSIVRLQEISTVDFVGIKNDGGIMFIYHKKYDITMYPNDFQLPVRSGRKNKNYDVNGVKNTKQCERDFFILYQKALHDILQSSADKKYILKFYRKFPKKIGEIIYYDKNDIIMPVFNTLYKQGFIFLKTKDIDYCNELRKKLHK